MGIIVLIKFYLSSVALMTDFFPLGNHSVYVNEAQFYAQVHAYLHERTQYGLRQRAFYVSLVIAEMPGDMFSSNSQLK